MELTCMITLTNINYSNFVLFIAPANVNTGAGLVLTYTPSTGNFASPSLRVEQPTGTTNQLTIRHIFPCLSSNVRTHTCQDYIKNTTSIRHVDDGATMFDVNNMTCQRFAIGTKIMLVYKI
eukprot:UN07590